MYIYLTINKINGKKYIGLSSKSSDETKNYYGSGSLLTKAIKKYGKENFEKEILEDNIESFSLLCEREKYYINLYDAVKSHDYYNIENGGISTSFWNNVDDVYKKEIADKISKKLKSHFIKNPFDQKAIDSLQESLRIFFIKRVKDEIEFYDILYKNKNFSDLKKYRRKKSYKIWISLNNNVNKEIFEECKKTLKKKRSKKIYKFTKDGTFIECYNSLDEAMNENGLKSKSLLSLACSGKRNHYFGYRWSYEELPHEIIIKKSGRKKGSRDTTKRKKNHSVSNLCTILQFKDDKLIKEWKSATEVANSLNISRQMLLIKIRKESEYIGFIWKKGKKYTVVKYSSS